MKKTIWLINQYASTPETGIGGRHYYFARELAKQGHQVYLIAASYTHLLRHPAEVKNDFKVDAVEGFNIVWVKVAKYTGAHSKKRILNWFSFAWKLRGLKHINLESPDAIVYSSPSLIGFLGAKHLASYYDAYLAFEVRDIWPLTLVELGGYTPQHPFIRFLQWVEDKAYRDADFVISNLKNSVAHMTERGMIYSKFSWIANGFSMDEVAQKQSLSQKTIDQLVDDKFIVGYAGTFGFANALDSLVLAAELLKDNKDVVFCLVGDGKEKKNLERLVSGKNLSNVRFVDAIPKVQIQSMLDRFDVCFIGLTADPLFRFGVSPNKLFDYFYSAKPIIYAIESGPYTPVTDSQSGIQIPAENPEAIADAVVRIYQKTKSERAMLGQNGRRYAVENHEYASLARKLTKALFGDE
ncbi:glycosyltransferase family 4 protein [Stutzerimonas stutzeri]|uniref:Glycosyltransferase WbuB n=1 Tax=Stutzerimonas stutzeri TaxID=316 RepID=A0A172WTE7_STUST|nr:glycosyltransferase family 4 protein [Stutzerimonas stutzeri]ANF26723.1 glycosyltransferase WbuB [Stutzerimonas stutzeri]